MAMMAQKIQSAKTAAIEEAKKTFADYNNFIFADYRGMTVEQITQLRKKLREQNAVLKVVKNNFARIAFESMDINNVADLLKGPTVVAMTTEEANVVAKTPGKKELIAMLMSAINGPARQLAATIKAYAEKKEAEGGN